MEKMDKKPGRKEKGKNVASLEITALPFHSYPKGNDSLASTAHPRLGGGEKEEGRVRVIV